MTYRICRPTIIAALLLLRTLLVALPTCSAGEPDNHGPSEKTLNKLADRCEAFRAGILLDLRTEQKYLEAMIPKAQRGRVDKKLNAPIEQTAFIRFPSAQAKKDRIAECQSRLTEVRAKLDEYSPDDVVMTATLPLDPKIGDAGFCVFEMLVVEIIDAETMIVEGHLGGEYHPGGARKQDIERWEVTDLTAIIEGVPTKGLVAGQKTTIPESAHMALVVIDKEKDTFLLKAFDASTVKFMIFDRRRATPSADK